MEIATDMARGVRKRHRSARVLSPAVRSSSELAAAFLPRIHGRRTNGREDWPNTDRPLELVAEVRRLAGGRVRIDYSVLFANEDGGTKTRDLLAHWGRTTDYEPAYSVEVDAVGQVVAGSERYQSRGHRWRSYTGPRDAGRAVLHVATANNMFAPGVGDSQHKLNLKPLVVDRASGAKALDALDVMRRSPDTWRAMAQEVRREGKVRPLVAGRGIGGGIEDPRRYLYVSAAPQSGCVLDVQLRNGRRVTVRVPKRTGIPDGRSIAVVLPPGVVGAHIRSVEVADRSLAKDLVDAITVLDDRDEPRTFATQH